MSRIARRSLVSQCRRFSSPSLLSSTNTTPQPPPSSSDSQIDDDEWSLRAGRAIDTLHHTLPSFFTNGLYGSLPPPTSYLASNRNADRVKGTDHDTDAESIYDPSIRLSYTPPAAIAPPFWRTMHVDGYPLYMASAAFIRHTLNALYSHTALEIRSFSVYPPPSSTPARNETRVVVRKFITGSSRVSSAPHEWHVVSRYALHPQTARICQHVIEDITPAPTSGAWEALRGGLSFGKTQNEVGGVACAERAMGCRKEGSG